MRSFAGIAECYHDRSVVVLGASGFIGRWTARLLSRSGARLHVVVRDRAATEKILSTYEISADVVELDLYRLTELTSWIRKLNVAALFNLAGYGVDPTERDDRSAYVINAELVAAVCRALSDCRNRDWTGQNIVHVGSAAEYGDTRGPLTESTIATPSTTYGKSKLQGTRTLLSHCARAGLRGLTARLFTVYGPGEHPGRLLPTLLEASGNSEDIPLTRGQQERDFTYVEDVAEGLLRLGLASVERGAIVNLATGRLSSVREFVSQAKSVLGIASNRLMFGAIGDGAHDMKQPEASTRRLLELAGWVPSTPIEEGVRRTLDFRRTHET